MWCLLNLLPNLRWLTHFRWLISLFNFTFIEDVHDEGPPERVTSNIYWLFLRRFKALYTVRRAIPSLTKRSTTWHCLNCGFFTIKFSRSFRKNSLSFFYWRIVLLFYYIFKKLKHICLICIKIESYIHLITWQNKLEFLVICSLFPNGIIPTYWLRYLVSE